jgi:hypothetical protein
MGQLFKERLREIAQRTQVGSASAMLTISAAVLPETSYDNGEPARRVQIALISALCDELKSEAAANPVA